MRRRRLAPVDSSRDSEVDGAYGGEEESGKRRKLHIALNAVAKLSTDFLEHSLYMCTL